MSARPMQLVHANLFVRDVDCSEKFYRDVLGLKVTNRRSKMSFLSANDEVSHELALIEIGNDAPGPEGRKRVGLNHLAWQMASFEDLKEVYRRLKEHGAEIIRIGDHNVSVGVYFLDPDGNEMEVYYELPRDQWPQGKDGDLFTGQKPFPWSLDDEAIVESPRRSLVLQ